MTIGVFTQNQPPWPARSPPKPVGSEGPEAPPAEPMTYPHATRIPVHVDIKHALSSKYAAAWRKAIRSVLASLHSKGAFRMESLPLVS
jgi:hypothetical protein